MVTKISLATVPKIKLTPKIGIDDKNRDAVCQILTALLADEYVLSAKTRKYHWNVNGPRFHPLHEFLRTQYVQLDEIVDEVAERIPQLGGKTIATLEEFKKLTRIKEDPGQYPDADRILSNLLADHETIIRSIRPSIDACDEEYKDMGTNDFLIGIMQIHEKTAWMIRAHLEGKT
jgi:starvation-inducible DNA-binding protein